MEVMKKLLCMNIAGDGETSYANNSGLQKVMMSKSLRVLDETLKDIICDHVGFPKCFKMMDMGCSSGPNTLLAMSGIINTIEDLYREKNINELPEFEVFLNDLPDNDFNNLFKLLPQENGNCFVYGLPGSFYGRLLPKKSLHFLYSSYSIHWLSQVPEGLEDNHRQNIYMATESPPEVYKAYAKQYERDFSTFLKLRGEEIVPGGRMVLTFNGRSVEDPSSKDDLAIFTLLAKTLVDMVDEGLVKMDDLYSFNIPIYSPCTREVEAAILSEGSFTLDRLEVFRVCWDASDYTVDDDQQDPSIFDKQRSGKFVADCVRAITEPMLASHFGSTIMDLLFGRYAKKMVEHLSVENSSYFSIVVSLSRR
uniref:Benzoic acid carboxymethyl transferase n=1 Tax=Antirrhinum linkianum TaxID=102601 RepID=A0A1B1SP62_ANTLN|nr:benzoic acid carboxymethyl transferase [Antirrhinum linkianum]